MTRVPTGGIALKTNGVSNVSQAVLDLLSGTGINVVDNGDGTVSFNATGGGGGQTLFEAVVASSGGTHTTLASAIASGAKSIFVRDGTYAEGAITSSTAGLLIVGASKNAVISIGTTTCSLSGDNTIITNISLTASTGRFLLSGLQSLVTNCYLEKTGTSNQLFLFNGASNSIFSNNIVKSTGSLSGTSLIQLALNNICSNNTFQVASMPTSGEGIIRTTDVAEITNNVFKHSSNNGISIYTAGQNVVITGNSFVGNSSTTCAIYMASSLMNISDNKIKAFARGIEGGASSGVDIIITGNFFVSTNIAITANNACNRWTVTGNYMHGQSAYGYFILINGVLTNWTVTGNSAIAITQKFISNTANMSLSVISGNNVTPQGKFIDNGSYNTISNNSGATVLEETLIKQMKNANGSAIAIGDVVILAPTNGDEVNTTTTSGNKAVYGVVVATTIASTAYGEVMTKGKHSAVKVDGSGTAIAVGDFLMAGTGAGRAVKATAGNTAFAIALGATSASTTIACLLIEPRLI